MVINDRSRPKRSDNSEVGIYFTTRLKGPTGSALTLSNSTHSGKFDHAYRAAEGRGAAAGTVATSALSETLHSADTGVHLTIGSVQLAAAQTSTTEVEISQQVEQLCVGPHTTAAPDVKRTSRRLSSAAPMDAPTASGLRGSPFSSNIFVLTTSDNRRPTSVLLCGWIPPARSPMSCVTQYPAGASLLSTAFMAIASAMRARGKSSPMPHGGFTPGPHAGSQYGASWT